MSTSFLFAERWTASFVHFLSVYLNSEQNWLICYHFGRFLPFIKPGLMFKAILSVLSGNSKMFSLKIYYQYSSEVNNVTCYKTRLIRNSSFKQFIWYSWQIKHLCINIHHFFVNRHLDYLILNELGISAPVIAPLYHTS